MEWLICLVLSNFAILSEFSRALTSLFTGGCAPTAVSTYHSGTPGQLDHGPWSDRGQAPNYTLFFHLSFFVVNFKVKEGTLILIDFNVGDLQKIDKQHCVHCKFLLLGIMIIQMILYDHCMIIVYNYLYTLSSYSQWTYEILLRGFNFIFLTCIFRESAPCLSML